ncbi:MAG: HAMP domain-containing sensor histidine kinase [Bacteroidales bacterium]|nr:HAMP domain-containing sensor histidine kinase [Bacteroidales bacterium]
MNKRILYILIAGICISLIGVIAVQFFWIRNAIQVKEAQFARSVNDALGSVVSKIEARENMSFISRNYEGDSIMRIVQAFTRDTNTSVKNRLDSLLLMNELPVTKNISTPPSRPTATPPRDRQPGGVIHYSYQYNVFPVQHGQDSVNVQLDGFFSELQFVEQEVMNFEWDDQLARLDSMVNLNSPHSRFEFEGQPIGPENFDAGEILIETPTISGPRFLRYRVPQFSQNVPFQRRRQENRNKQKKRETNIQKLDNKARKIQEVIKQMAIALETKPAPIQQRINKKSLQAALSKSFKDKGIDLPFEFAVFSPSSDSNHIPIRSADFQCDYEKSGHRISLFPNDLFQKPDMLLVFFPGQKSQVLRSLSWLFIGSILFTLVIMLSSGGSIIVMIRQKKISDIKTDFINNMTHEFKTPIATISIAADSITNSKVISEPETIKNFTRIIKEENNRMNTRVEQVLQMALLDSRDFKLRPELTDMNHLIEKTVEHYRLQIEQREGFITTRLDAGHSVAYADVDHMRNVLLNLLDNANKYSIIRPEIEVFSFNRSGSYTFGIQDKGVGMSQEAQRKVFDKFFRVTSGNIHNIKGFGLGLSYVKAIVLAHHGNIRIQSELGKGSRFEISLPGVPQQEQGQLS